MQLDGFVDYKTNMYDQIDSIIKMVVEFVNLEHYAKQEPKQKLRVAEASTNQNGVNLVLRVLAGQVIFVLWAQLILVKTYARLVISVRSTKDHKSVVLGPTTKDLVLSKKLTVNFVQMEWSVQIKD